MKAAGFMYFCTSLHATADHWNTLRGREIERPFYVFGGFCFMFWMQQILQSSLKPSFSLLSMPLLSRMCLTECLMLHFFTNNVDQAAGRAVCRLLNRKGQQGWTKLTGREPNQSREIRGASEAEDDLKQISVARISFSVVGLKVECVSLTVQHLCLHLFRLCQIRQVRGALWCWLIFY